MTALCAEFSHAAITILDCPIGSVPEKPSPICTCQGKEYRNFSPFCVFTNDQGVKVFGRIPMFCPNKTVESGAPLDKSPIVQRYQACLDDESESTVSCDNVCNPPPPIKDLTPQPGIERTR
jgi:hypothetical protein